MGTRVLINGTWYNIAVLGFPEFLEMSKDGVAWFDGYTRVTRQFLGRSIFQAHL
jgi:hypothetical protein